MRVRLMTCCDVAQNEQLFGSWSEMFRGSGAPLDGHVGVYSFDGRDVITDPSW